VDFETLVEAILESGSDKLSDILEYPRLARLDSLSALLMDKQLCILYS
jgi:hypothetical protein